MAFRAAGQLKSMVKNGLGGRWRFSTSTSQKLRASAPTSDHFLIPPQDFKAKLARGDFVPKCMAAGMMAVSTSLGVYTALHQLHSAPNVRLKKSRRETIPEVVEPEQVAVEAEKFVKKSLFRKLAHLKDFNSHQVVPNPIAGDICTRPLPIETLKDIGVVPKP